uniref:Uncharacterized protein n=1 Tax=Anguilla anguilla TaxID=7936 RepID=A0A0E9PS80_ANGAN
MMMQDSLLFTCLLLV